MLAIIPARGGSKGLPGKNIRDLCGRPLISHIIRAALEAREIDRVVVSTDVENIAAAAREAGAEVPFLRPAELARDDSAAMDAYLYTCARLEEMTGKAIEAFCVCLPTTPLTLPSDLDSTIRLFTEKEADSVIAVVENEKLVHYSMHCEEDRSLQYVFAADRHHMPNRQEMKPTYLPSGAAYVFRHAFLKKKEGYFSDKTYGYVMPPERSIDINNLFDFRIAEFVMREKLHLNT